MENGGGTVKDRDTRLKGLKYLAWRYPIAFEEEKLLYTLSQMLYCAYVNFDVKF